jgi:hypothetical protein
MRKFATTSFVMLSVVLLVASGSYAQKDPDTAGPPSNRSSNEAAILTPPDFFAGGADAVNIWHVKCKAATTICADVADIGPNFDNTFHVSVVCTGGTAAHKGQGNTEFTDGGTSSFACTTNKCPEAMVLFTCDANDFCDDDFNSIIDCANKAFVAGFPKQTESQ